MKNILKLKLYGCTVRGIDRRDNSPFEDHVVIFDSSANGLFDYYKCVQDVCSEKGFNVCRRNIIPDKIPIPDTKEGIIVDLDLEQLYSERIQQLKEQQNQFTASSERK